MGNSTVHWCNWAHMDEGIAPIQLNVRANTNAPLLAANCTSEKQCKERGLTTSVFTSGDCKGSAATSYVTTFSSPLDTCLSSSETSLNLIHQCTSEGFVISQLVGCDASKGLFESSTYHSGTCMRSNMASGDFYALSCVRPSSKSPSSSSPSSFLFSLPLFFVSFLLMVLFV